MLSCQTEEKTLVRLSDLLKKNDWNQSTKHQIILNFLFAVLDFHQKGFIHNCLHPRNIEINPETLAVTLVETKYKKRKEEKITIDLNSIDLENIDSDNFYDIRYIPHEMCNWYQGIVSEKSDSYTAAKIVGEILGIIATPMEIPLGNQNKCAILASIYTDANFYVKDITLASDKIIFNDAVQNILMRACRAKSTERLPLTEIIKKLAQITEIWLSLSNETCGKINAVTDNDIPTLSFKLLASSSKVEVLASSPHTFFNQSSINNDQTLLGDRPPNACAPCSIL